MLLSDESSIKKHIKTAEKKGGYFIYGDESYLSVFYANSLASSVTDTSGTGFNYYYFDSDNITFDALYEACETLPVMSDKVCVFVKDFPFMKLTADELEQYTEYIPGVPDTTVLIFLMATTEIDIKTNPKWRNIIDLFSKNGTVICLSKRTDNAVAELLVRSAAKRNTSVSKENAAYLIEIVGNEMTTLLNEFDKVCSFAGGKEITKEMIDEVAVKSVESSVYDLAKNINSRRSDKAFEILSDLIKNKTDPLIIIGTLSMEYVDMYRMKISEKYGGSARDYLADFSSYKGKSFRLEKARQSQRNFTEKQIRDFIEALSKADIKIKSFSFNNVVILEELAARLIYIAGNAS